LIKGNLKIAKTNNAFFNFQDSAENDKGPKVGKKSFAVAALNKNVYIWAGFFTFSLLIYFMVSGGDFSFLMTYGAMARMFGFGILNVKTWKSRRASGVSIKTLQLYSLVFFFRLTSIFRHEGYLPYDKSGDWLYHIIELIAFIVTSSALYGCMVPFKGTYQADLDRFGEFNVPPGYGAVYLAGPALIVAIFIHPSLNSDFMSDVAWTYSMYLESLALIPQLYMFQKQASGVVELLTAHFVAALGFGRMMEFCFWMYSYHELATSAGSKLPGYLALMSQVMQLVLLVDFFWYYFQAVKNATPLVLPQHGAGMSIV
jgi:ER lumen protein retaining receptor